MQYFYIQFRKLGKLVFQIYTMFVTHILEVLHNFSLQVFPQIKKIHEHYIFFSFIYKHFLAMKKNIFFNILQLDYHKYKILRWLL
jgi:hypothetical protein